MMSIKKKLTRTGNSLALVLDKIVLEMVGADKDTVFDVSVKRGQIVLRVHKAVKGGKGAKS